MFTSIFTILPSDDLKFFFEQLLPLNYVHELELLIGALHGTPILFLRPNAYYIIKPCVCFVLSHPGSRMLSLQFSDKRVHLCRISEMSIYRSEGPCARSEGCWLVPSGGKHRLSTEINVDRILNLLVCTLALSPIRILQVTQNWSEPTFSGCLSNSCYLFAL